jgi:hypothetical protein
MGANTHNKPGLAAELYDLMVENLGEENVNATKEGKAKIKALTQGLAKIITDYVLRQPFVITEMNAPVMTGTGPGITSLSRQGKGMTGNPLENFNTFVTEVRADSIKSDELLPSKKFG